MLSGEGYMNKPNRQEVEELNRVVCGDIQYLRNSQRYSKGSYRQFVISMETYKTNGKDRRDKKILFRQSKEEVSEAVYDYYCNNLAFYKILRLKYEIKTSTTNEQYISNLNAFVEWYSNNIGSVTRYPSGRYSIKVMGMEGKLVFIKAMSLNRLIEHYYKLIEKYNMGNSLKEQFGQELALQFYERVKEFIGILKHNEELELDILKIRANLVEYIDDLSKSILFRGVTYKSSYDFCNMLGFEHSALRKHLASQDNNIELAVQMYLKTMSNKTMEKVAKCMSFYYPVIDYRLRLGMTLYDALYNVCSYVYVGRLKYRNLKGFCEKNNIDLQMVEYVLKNEKKTVEFILANKDKFGEYIEHKKDNRKSGQNTRKNKAEYRLENPVTLYGVIFNSYKEICDYYGVPQSMISYGLNNGRTLEDIIFGFDKRKPIVEDKYGNKFFCLQDLCSHYDSSYSALSSKKWRNNKKWQEQQMKGKGND